MARSKSLIALEGIFGACIAIEAAVIYKYPENRSFIQYGPKKSGM